jgi:hypothetical protein
LVSDPRNAAFFPATVEAGPAPGGLHKVLRIRAFAFHQGANFSDTLWQKVVLTLAPEAKSWSDVARRTEFREGLLKNMGANKEIDLIVRTTVQMMAKGIGRTLVEPELSDRAAFVLSYFGTPIYLYSRMIRRLVEHGQDMGKNERANAIWDYQIAFSTGRGANIRGMPVFLVTDDGAILDATAVANARRQILSLGEYQSALLGGGVDELIERAISFA